LNHEEIKDKVLNWIAELDYIVLKVTKTEINYFIFTIKSKVKSPLNFPINVSLSKKQQFLVLGFTGWMRGEDNKSFRGTDKKYIEKMFQELWDRARISNLDFSCESKNDETRLRTIKGIYPHEITKDKFFRTMSELTEFREYMHYTLKKYKFAKPKGDNYEI
jgi:hypothetical protein